MSYQFYKITHFVGLMFLFIGLATILILAFTSQLQNKRAKMIGFITHGVGLFLMLLGGFGMLARLGIVREMPGWVYAKLVVWVLLGIAISLVKRKPQWAFFNLILIVALGGTAAYLALFKPF